MATMGVINWDNFALLQGNYFTLCLFMHMCVTLMARAGEWMPMPLPQALIFCVFTTFGGGIIGGITLNKVPFPARNDVVIPMLFLAMMMVKRFEERFQRLKQLMTILAQFWRTHAIVGMVKLAQNEITTESYFDEGPAIVGPILIGTLAGCGGMFFFTSITHAAINCNEGPFGVKWSFFTAFISAFYYHVSTSRFQQNPDRARQQVGFFLFITAMSRSVIMQKLKKVRSEAKKQQ